ncbi:MAG: hypothetical protein E6J79_10645 [Deltaproteobacteria bacterium]|nr:MAG: hypothetical protein E6J79_10645 [Deltaproteobacteria bacterium]
MRLRNIVATVFALAGFLGATATALGDGATAGPPVAPHVFTGDVRTLPPVSVWRAGDPTFGGPLRRQTHPPNAARPAHPRQGRRDTLLDAQTAGGLKVVAPRFFTPPDLDFEGQGFTGADPPDTVGDVGRSHYIQLVNTAGGSAFVVVDKSTGTVVGGPAMLSTLWTGGGLCASGFGDGIVLFDPLASRWLMSEFASRGNHLCVYVSRTSDPLGGGWFGYDFGTTEFPDYPKYAVWPDAYYLSTNESAPAAYALDRARMIAGLPAGYQRFTAPSLDGFGFQALTPADLDGSTPPPPGAPGIFLRHRDDELHDPGANDPTRDFLEVWELHADFGSPANSTFALAATIPVAEFDSELCAASPKSSCFPEPAGGTPLDPIREVVMWRAQYRNFGSHETLVGNFVTDVDGTDHGGIRWFELRRSGGPWGLFQEGTYAPDGNDRWLGSIAMDGGGNLAMGYSITSPSVFPGIRYTGRLATDPAGTMTVAETSIAAGSGVQDNERWGDYSSMNLDPLDDCTFWYTNEYIPADGRWRTRIARIRFTSPTCVDAPAPSCGNGVREVGEDCDGADAPFCAGLCRPDCTCPVPICGNDVVELGEECDGTSASACATGVCSAACTCTRCPATPSAGCRTAAPGRSSVQVTDQLDDARDQLRWLWNKGAATAIGDFADPVHGSASYALCLYDGSPNPQPLSEASIPPGGICGSTSCWRATTTGFTYHNRAATPAGVVAAKLRAGSSDSALVQVSGKGANLPTPNPSLTLPVTVQLLIRSGATTQCWETRYTTARQNDDQHFRASGP